MLQALYYVPGGLLGALFGTLVYEDRCNHVEGVCLSIAGESLNKEGAAIIGAVLGIALWGVWLLWKRHQSAH